MNNCTALKKILRILLIVTGLWVLIIRSIIGNMTESFSTQYLFSTVAYFIYLGMVLVNFILLFIYRKQSDEKHPVFFITALLTMLMAYLSLISFWNPDYVYNDLNMEFLLSFGAYGTDFLTSSFFFYLLYYAMNLSVLQGIAALILLKEKGKSSKKKSTASKKQKSKRAPDAAFRLQQTGFYRKKDGLNVFEAQKTASYSTKTDTTTQVDIFDQNDHFFSRHTRDDIF